LTNLVNLLQQQNNRFERVEKNQEKIPTEIATKIKVVHQNSHHRTSAVVDDVVSVPINRHRGSGKPPYYSDKESISHSPHCSLRRKPSGHHGGEDSSPHQGHWKKDDYSPERHCKSHRKCPFTRKIKKYPIPHVFAKPPKLENYDGTTDPDEHVEHIDSVFDYHQARGAVKFKLFVLTLKGTAMIGFKGLYDNSINSWGKLCEEFASHFTARQKQPKTMDTLNTIVLEKKETLREYVERFTREGVEVHNA